MKLRVSPSGPLRGVIEVAADKSISHRAVILGALASGRSRARNLLPGEDVQVLMAAFRYMGVRIEKIHRENSGNAHIYEHGDEHEHPQDEKTQAADVHTKKKSAGNEHEHIYVGHTQAAKPHAGGADYHIHGVGLHGLRPSPAALHLGNSGTALRLLAGVLCGQRFASELGGDASLSARPMGRIIEPLRRLGAVIEADGERPPLRISPSAGLRGIHYPMPVASAQVKSCLLLAGLYAEGVTSVAEPAPTRDHTERMLRHSGRMLTDDGAADGVIGVRAGELRPFDICVPADLSSAAFFLVAASIIPGSDVLVKNVGINPTRHGVLAILERMGARIEVLNRRAAAGEPVADLRVRAAALRGCRIDAADIASAIDEIPAIAIAAACAQGDTEIRGAAELRVKESDRISATVAGLEALGVGVSEHPDGLLIRGTAGAAASGYGLQGGRVDSRADHRIAMAFAIAGAVAADAVEVGHCDNIATSFPGFCRVGRAAGLTITELDAVDAAA